jgi:hypothetical protein
VNEAGTDMIGAAERVEHVAECLPEICTLDCGTMNFAEADYVMTNTPGMLRAMGRMMTDLGVKPEIEAFDTGHLWFAKELVKEGVLEAPALVQLCMGVPWGAPDDLNTFMAMVNNVPEDWTFSAFSLGRNQMAYAAAAVLAGGHVRVGLEDNLWLDKGVLATNAQLVERAVGVVEGMGARVIGPAGGAREARPDQARARRPHEPARRHHGGRSGIGRAIAERFLSRGPRWRSVMWTRCRRGFRARPSRRHRRRRRCHLARRHVGLSVARRGVNGTASMSSAPMPAPAARQG